MGDITIDTIRLAHREIRGGIAETPLKHAASLSQALGADIFLKFENLQRTGSFKERGALNRLQALKGPERARGVIAASAGNHAQGLACHGQRLGIAVKIVMPVTAPRLKIDRVKAYAADVILHGASFAEAAEHAERVAAGEGMIMVSAFDDASVVAGQGTVALEMLQTRPDLDCLAVQVGGGGLIAGMAVAAKALKPDIQVVGVQSELFPGLAAQRSVFVPALTRGRLSVAEGIAVEVPGHIASEIIQSNVDDVLVVRECMIEDAIVRLLEDEKVVCEGAGAASLAAVLQYPERFRGKRVGLVLSGGNIDLSLLAAVLERALVRRGRVVRMSVTAFERVGLLSELSGVIAGCSANIRQVSHDRQFAGANAKTAIVTFELEVPHAAAQASICRELEQRGMSVVLQPAAYSTIVS